MKLSKIVGAEALGTFILMLGGPGTAVLVPSFPGKVLMVSLAFGLSLLIAAYSIGHISGCHINPAVTVGLAVAKKTEWSAVPAYIVGQLVGAIVGGAAILGIVSGVDGGFTASPANFAVNGWNALSPGWADGQHFNFTAMLIVEIVLTALLIFVVLSTTNVKFPAGFGGVTAGLTLAVIHMISIPVDNTSVNPARSLGVAVFAGGDALSQLWAFIVFPIVGAVVGAVIYKALNE